MSSAITSHESFGSLEEILHILALLNTGKNSSFEDIESICLHDARYIRIPVNAIIDLLRFLGLLTIEGRSLAITERGKTVVGLSGSEAARIIMKLMIDGMQKSNEFEEFIDQTQIFFEPTQGLLAIKNAGIPIRFSCFKRLLFHMKHLKQSKEIPNHLIISSELASALERFLIPQHQVRTLEQLKNNVLRQEELGREGEEFILAYERERLKNHPFAGKIQRISEIAVSAGYDIVSFSSEDAPVNDLFIEVKSYHGQSRFFWSANEVASSQRLAERYALYLVDRAKMAQEGYEPTIIRNPAEAIFRREGWDIQPDGFFVRKIYIDATSDSQKDIS